MKKMSLLALVLTGLLVILGSTFIEAADPLMVQDMENMEIITPSAPEGGGWAVSPSGIGCWEMGGDLFAQVIESPPDDPVYYDMWASDEPLPLVINIDIDPDIHPAELVNVPAGYCVELTFDGGQKKKVYFPHITGDDLIDGWLSPNLYVAKDGSTYWDEALTQVAQAAGEVTPFSIKESAITKLERAKTGNKKIDGEIDRAINHIKNSLEKSLWLNAVTLISAPAGKRVFQEEHQAVMVMQTPKGKPPIVPPEVETVFNEVTNDLVKADKLIAERAVEEVKIFSGIDKRIDIQIKIAERELSWALREVKPSKAITRSGLAWKHAQLAKKLALSPTLVGKTVAKFTNQLEDAFTAGSWEDLTQAAATLMEMGKPAIPQLLIAFKDSSKNEMIRKMYAEILGEIKDSSAVGPLVEVLNNLGETEFVRAEAASALGEIGNSTATQPLIQALVDESEQIRSMAALSLGQIGNNRAVAPLLNTLNDSSETVRIRAGKGLAQLKAEEALEPFVDLLNNDPKESVRGLAALWLGDLEDSRAVVPLIEALKDKNEYIACNAAIALGIIKDVRAVDPLIEALKSKGLLRQDAADALAKIGDQRAVEPLREAIETETDTWGKEKLKEAYKTLTGEEYQ